jgi:hypothetical protein
VKLLPISIFAMRNTPAIFVTVLGLLASACNPLFSAHYRQALTPAPSSDCIHAALAASPHVVDFALIASKESAPNGREQFRVSLRDTLARGSDWPARVTHEAVSDTASRMTLTYRYMGYAQPSAAEWRRLNALAEQVLADVQAICAPDSPRVVECIRADGVFPTRPCPEPVL